jgi:hypothetical protein
MVLKSEIDGQRLKIQQLLEKISAIKDEIMKYQRQRQKDVWKLLNAVTAKVHN